MTIDVFYIFAFVTCLPRECLGGKQCASSDALILNAGVALAACDFVGSVEEVKRFNYDLDNIS